jgi:hypothetical protein
MDVDQTGIAPVDHALKRRADSTPAADEANDSEKRACKKAKHEHVADAEHGRDAPALDGQALVADLAQELECGCCAAVVYRPVVVMPCQHFFCGRYALYLLCIRQTADWGSCIVLWIKASMSLHR